MSNGDLNLITEKMNQWGCSQKFHAETPVVNHRTHWSLGCTLRPVWKICQHKRQELRHLLVILVTCTSRISQDCDKRPVFQHSRSALCRDGSTCSWWGCLDIQSPLQSPHQYICKRFQWPAIWILWITQNYQAGVSSRGSDIDNMKIMVHNRLISRNDRLSDICVIDSTPLLRHSCSSRSMLWPLFMVAFCLRQESQSQLKARAAMQVTKYFK